MSASEHRLYFLLQRVAHRSKKRADGALKDSAGLTTAPFGLINDVLDENIDAEDADRLAARLKKIPFAPDE